MNTKNSMSILLLFMLFPCKVELFLFPFDELAELVLFIIWGPSAPLPEILQINPMINMTSEEVIQYYGYHAEIHQVITDDGYILELHRIVAHKNRKTTKSLQREPILFVPALFSDSSSFISINKTHSPGFVFTDAGYDVWLQNHRGTRYSRKHVTLNPNTQKKFWDYSFHEMGVYDLPATVDYILKTTNKSQIYLTGHSLGGTAISVFLAEKQVYKEKVKAAFLWAPAVYVPRALFSMAGLPGLAQIGSMLLYIFGEMEILPYNNNTMLLISHFCSGPLLSIFCQMVVFSLMFSFPIALADYRKKGHLAYLLVRCLAGASVKTLRHYIQMVENRDFSQYDYGAKGNMIAYNQTTAPAYTLQNIEQPTYIYYCEYDMLVNSLDIHEASRNFTNLKGLIRIPELTFSHMDFPVSPSSKQYIYDSMITLMSTPQEILRQTANMMTSTPITIPTTKTPITNLITSTTIKKLTTSTTIKPLITSTLKDHFDNSSYLYNFLPMMILIFVIILLFTKFIHQQLSETKAKRAATKENFEI